MVPSARRHRHLAAHGGERVGIGGVEPAHLGGDVERRQRHRQHPAAGAEQPADPVEGRDVVAELLPETDDQQVADDVAAHLAGAVEAVLQDARPGLAPLVVAAQGGEGHPEVARRQDAELGAQPSGRAAVVGHGDDRGEVDREPAQRGQGRVQPVPAAESGDAGGSAVRSGHSRPRSRWTGITSYPASRSCREISSVIATLRCLPPVQPMATDMKRLPSRR